MDFSVKHGFTYMAILACVICILSFLVPSAEKANTESEETVASSWNVIKTNVGGSTYSSDMEDGEVGSNIHINVKVTFDPNTGKLPTDWENYKIVTTNEPYGVLPTPTKVGYVFTGWYTRTGYPINENELVKLGQDHTLTARWAQAQYTVEYYDGDKLLGHQKAYYEDTFNLLNFEDVEAEKTGYHFYKWRDANDVAYDGGQSVKQLCQNDGDVLKLYIDWQPNEYTVHFDGNQGSVSPTSKKVLFDDYYGSMPTATRQYYTFYGWYTAPDYTGTRINESDIYSIPSDSTLYAHWEKNLYTITYIIEGKSYEYSAYQGEPIEQPDTSKTGYTFLGWFDKETGGAQITDFGYKSQTVYAQYKANNYLVTFDPNGGTVETTEKTVTYDSKFGALPIPVKVGYVFEGWYLPDGTLINESTNVKILSDTTVTAKWTAAQYTVAYYSDSKKISESAHIYDLESNLKTISEMNLTKKGYIFQGWSRVASSSSVEFKDGALVSNLSTVNGSNVNLYAIWKPITYKIEYYNGNSLYGNSSHTYDKKSVLTSVETLKMNKPGFTFRGWTTESNGDEIVYQDKQEILNLSSKNGEIIKLYALWNTNNYTVTYYDRGKIVGTSSFSYNKSETLLSYVDLNMSKTGYHFKGWATSETDKNITYNDEDTVKNLTTIPNGNVNLYAIWEANNYTVNYFHNGIKVGSTKFTYDIASNLTKISELNISKEGYNFTGWGKSDTSSEINFNDGEIVKNLTSKNNDIINLYSKWAAKTYTVTFNPNGGSVSPTTKTVVYDSTFGILPIPTRTGYTFDGWYLNNTKITSSSKVTITSDSTLNAKWTPIVYTISYNGNGATAGTTASSVHTYDVSKKLNKNNFTKTGCAFIGWSTSINGNVIYRDEDEVLNLTAINDKTVTLYAVWQTNAYNIYFDANGGTTPTASKIVAYNELYGLLPIPTRNGYTFNGWFTEESAGNEITSSSVMNTPVDHTLYAHWTPNTYILEMYHNNNKISTQTMTYGQSAKVPSVTDLNISKTGYSFAGWTKNQSTNTIEFTDGATVKNLAYSGTVKVYSVWHPNSYTVTFDANGGTVNPTSKTVTYDSTYGTLPTPTRSGYSFAGWYNGSSVIASGTPVKTPSNHVLTAKWSVSYDTTYTVKHYLMNVNGVGYTLNKTETLSGPTNSTVSFAGLSKNYTGFTYKEAKIDGSSTPTTDSSTTIKGDGSRLIELYYSRNQYDITVSKGTGINSVSGTGTYYFGANISVNATVSTGYTFSQWTSSNTSLLPNSTKSSYAFTIPAGDIQLTASAKAITYTIIYNGNGATGGSTAPSTHTYNTAKTLTTNGYTRTGYTFKGWSTSSTATSATYANNASVKNLTSIDGATVNLYAVWQINDYSLSINPNGGTYNGKSSTQTFTDNYNKLKLLGIPSKTGYTFTSWTLSGSGTISRYGTSLNNDTFFKTGNNGVSVYNNSGNSVVTHTRQASQSDNPTGSGYEIKIAHSGGTSTPGLGGFVQSTNSKANGVFYHIFTAKIPVGYTLNIAMNSTGTGRTYSWLTSNKGTGEYETYIYKLTCGSTGTFSTFGHVYLTGNGPVTWYLAGSTVLDATNGINMNASAQVYTYAVGAGSLTANWTANTYTIVYNGNGATGGTTTSSVHNYGTAKALTINGFTKSGYTFKGWATSPSGEVVYTDGQTVTNLTAINGQKINLYAVWEQNTFRQIVQVRYENADGSFTDYENVIDKNYSVGTTVSWSREKDACYEAKSVSYTVTGAKTTQLTIMRNRFSLTIAGLYNGSNTTSLGPVGKNDVYINGTLSVSATNSYSVAQRYGATYEIKNIVANAGYKYLGVSSGSLSGTITSNTTVRLNFNSVYKINFYSNKTLLGSLSNIAYTQSKTLTTGAALNATLTGYTFVGWDTVYLGDVNKDGTVNYNDSILVSQHISGTSTLTAEQQVIGDYNRNGELDTEDVTAISATDTGNKPYIGARITYDDGQSISKLTSTPNGVVNLYATYTDIQAIADSKENSLTFPIGYVMQTTSSTNPGNIYGGTWTQVAKGRTLVGVDENDEDFDTVEKIGGTKEITLTIDQLPGHDHTGTTSSNGSHSHSFNSNTSASYGVGTMSTTGTTGIPYIAKTHGQEHLKKGNVSIGASDTHSHSFTTNGTGGSVAHNNMQPYYVVYTWKKISDHAGADEYYTVNFIDGLTGETLKTEQVKAAESATPPTPPTHTDYEFIGWSDSYTEIYKNTTIKAQYKSNKEYTTTLDGLTWISNTNGSIDVGVAYTSNDPNLKFIWKFYDINADKWYLITPNYNKSNWASWFPAAGSYWLHVEALGSDGQTYTQTTGYNVTDNTHLRTGWIKFSDGTWHHYQNNGAVTTKWLSDGGYWYYLDPSSNGAMKTGWGYIDDNWYYFDSSGHMKTGWVQSGNYWYYMQSSGEMITGWKQIGGYWYYFEVDSTKTLGHMYANCTVNINGVTYTFDSNGHMI